MNQTRLPGDQETMHSGPQFSIVIQAGGQSSRMQQDKALMPFLGQPLIARQVARLRGAADEILVITNRPEDYAFLGVPLVQDLLPGTGLLGGLYTALMSARTAVLAVVACDMPFINAGLLLAQRDLLVREGADVVVPRSPAGLEPMHMVYRRETCLPAVHAALEQQQRRMISWFGAVRVREMGPEELAPHDPHLRAFTNVNTPEEFAEAEAAARAEE
jgi:molybdopterin-guanine dinucleotide biosynthesis protein A